MIFMTYVVQISLYKANKISFSLFSILFVSPVSFNADSAAEPKRGGVVFLRTLHYPRMDDDAGQGLPMQALCIAALCSCRACPSSSTRTRPTHAATTHICLAQRWSLSTAQQRIHGWLQVLTSEAQPLHMLTITLHNLKFGSLSTCKSCFLWSNTQMQWL